MAQSMDFFAHQDEARRRTGLLMVYFVLAIVGIVAAIYVTLTLGLAFAAKDTDDFARHIDWDTSVLFGVAIATLIIVTLGTLYKTLQLSHGGKSVARLLGGRRVLSGTTSTEERRLLNIVEEMAIASGIAVPEVYVLDSERGINAFAAGFSPADAVIGVTSGALEQLSRDELQGVMAHEFSHIVHGDMRLNIRLMGILHGILLIAMLGYFLLRFGALSGGSGRRRSSRQSKGNAGIALVAGGLALMLIGYIGVFFANLIKSAVSRQREFLADASAVQYTRNPGGIAGALKRIGRYSMGSRVRDVHAAEASHLFFGNATQKFSLAGLLATHPPLSQRIRRLDPDFNPDIAAMASGATAAGAAGVAGVSNLAGGGVAEEAQSAVAQTGGMTSEHLDRAHRLLDALPQTLTDAVRSPLSARTIMYASLLQSDPDTRMRQIEAIGADPETRSAVTEAERALRTVPPMGRLALAELAVPALRELSADAYRTFEDTLQRVMIADDRINLFEYAMHRLLLRHLAPAFGKVDRARVRYRHLGSILPDVSVVVAAIAAWGSDDPETARQAYDVGMQRLKTDSPPPFPAKTVALSQVDKALDKLAEASPSLKKPILEACAACVTADGRIGPDQGELLRAVADALDCPMPPLDLG